jgi:hypothetical protein
LGNIEEEQGGTSRTKEEEHWETWKRNTKEEHRGGTPRRNTEEEH